jgi:hypothetical protein
MPRLSLLTEKEGATAKVRCGAAGVLRAMSFKLYLIPDHDTRDHRERSRPP